MRTEPTFLLEGQVSDPKEVYYTAADDEVTFQVSDVPALGVIAYCLIRRKVNGVWKIIAHGWGRNKLDAFIETSNQLSIHAVAAMRNQDPPSMTAPEDNSSYRPAGTTPLKF